MKLCKTCKVEKNNNEFGVNKYSKDKLNYSCNICRAEHEQKRRLEQGIQKKRTGKIIDLEHKECIQCHEILHIDQFSKNNRGLLERASYCKKCQAKYITELHQLDPLKYKKSAKIATQKYRDTHREWWRSLHRKNQFQRKYKIKLVSDGTVTESFMRELYSKDTCYWCKNVIDPIQRTAEHIIPLNLGGTHSASNLTMACVSCNSAKLNFKL